MATQLPPIPSGPNYHATIDPTITVPYDAADIDLGGVQWASGSIQIVSGNTRITAMKAVAAAKKKARRPPMKPRRTKMTLVIVPPTSVPGGHPCSMCAKTVRPGQRVLFQKIYSTRSRTDIIVIHESCVSPVVGGEAQVIGTRQEREYETNRQYQTIRDNIEKDPLFS